MTAPYQRTTEDSVLGDLARRVRILEAVPPKGVMDYAWMSRTTDLSIANGSYQAITGFDTAGGVLGSSFTTDLPNGRVHVLRTGLYTVHGQLKWAAASQPVDLWSLQVNGFVGGAPVDGVVHPSVETDNTLGYFPFNTGSGAAAGNQGTATLTCVISQLGDTNPYFQTRTGQNDGGARTVDHVEFIVVRLGDS